MTKSAMETNMHPGCPHMHRKPCATATLCRGNFDGRDKPFGIIGVKTGTLNRDLGFLTFPVAILVVIHMLKRAAAAFLEMRTPWRVEKRRARDFRDHFRTISITAL